MVHMTDDTTDAVPAPRKGGMSRRTLLTGAGLAGAGLAVAGTTGVASAAPDKHGRGSPHAVGISDKGTTGVEFRGRIAQTGQQGDTFTSYGFLTKAAGASDGDLFAGSPPAAGTALLTAYATGDLVNRVLDVAVHALDIVGVLTVYQRSAPGASFDDPSSFAVGTPVGRFSLTLQDVLAVFAPDS